MLTNNQIIELEKLKEIYPKFKKFLNDAITTWSTKANPIQNEYGVSQSYNENNKMEFDINHNPVCCLIGAATVGKEIPKTSDKLDEYDEVCLKYFNLSKSDVISILYGFDDGNDLNKICFNKEAYEFASNVRKIIFGE